MWYNIAMAIQRVTDSITALLCRDWHRRLFDELIPLPDGTSYNAYVVAGTDKVALIDTADPRCAAEFTSELDALKLPRIDFIVSNHAEQDHSGCLPLVAQKYPEASILATPKGKEILTGLLPVPPERIRPVQDGETVSLGGRTLQFIHAPWVHWPETMLTAVPEESTLFPCDLFGSHLATSAAYADDRPRVLEAAKRYYAEIMMPFRAPIARHLEKIASLNLSRICPSHGPMHADPSWILAAYRDWVSDRVSNEVVVPFVSMHGSVAAMVRHFTNLCEQLGIAVIPFDLPVSDAGKIAISLVDAATVVAGTPTVLAGPHPACAHALTLINALRPKTRVVSFLGSYSWATRLHEQVPALVPNLKAKFLPPVVARGFPGQADLERIASLASAIADEHRCLGVLP